MKLRLLFSFVLCALAFNAFAQINSVGIIGDATPTGWDSDTDMTKVNDSTWTANITLIGGKFVKFRADDAWTTNWGSPNFPVGTGTQGGDNIPVYLTGTYDVVFNSNSGAYEFSVPSPIGILGSATPKGWDADVNMFQDSMDANKFYQVLRLKKGEAKFRANDGWDVNWGAADFPAGVGVKNGPNIPVNIDGLFRIDFDTASGAYNFELLEAAPGVIGIIGSATPGGWDTDTYMTQDPNNSSIWTVNIDLTVGALKFRADTAWTLNWGGNSFPSGAAVQNGNDIQVDAAGRYQVTLNLQDLTYNFLLIRPYVNIGIIGTANPGGFDTPSPLQKDPNQEGIWTGRYVLLTGDAFFKADNDIWGGSGFPTGTAEIDGPPVPIGAFEYNITFNAITGAYSFDSLQIFNTIGLIGPSTPIGNWDTDVDMTKDANDEMFWFIPEILLSAGECKFRAEDAWTINWGAPSEGTAQEEPMGIGTQDGKNFKVKAGNYGVTLRAVKNAGEYSFGSPLKANELVRRSVMNLSPNPTRNVLNLEITDAEFQGDVDIRIFSSLGEQVYNNKLYVQDRTTLQIGDLEPGVYWLHLSNGKYFAGKQFVVNK